MVTLRVDNKNVTNNYQLLFKKICPSPLGRNYDGLGVINRGAYGIVYKARDTETGDIMAVKHEFRGLCQSTMREIIILKLLPPHPSIVRFQEAFQDDAGRVFVVMEYLENDLRRFINAKKEAFTVSEVKTLMKQILEGVSFLHKHAVMHRDIKPANILINNKGQLKICDFGLSRNQTFPDLGFQRELGPNIAGYTRGVGTRWYKAPELLLGERIYSVAVDMWSVGCIMAELVLKEVFFRGNSEEHQIECICQILSAGDLVWTKFTDAAAFSGAPWLGDSGFDLMERLLTMDPEKRINAEDALNHKWFKEE